MSDQDTNADLAEAIKECGAVAVEEFQEGDGFAVCAYWDERRIKNTKGNASTLRGAYENCLRAARIHKASHG